MKILYAIQGTGNGHISRAKILVPLLRQYAHVDILISGKHNELKLSFPVEFYCQGFGFFFGKNGDIDFYKSLSQASLSKFFEEVNSVPVTNYDAVVNDFEPVSAWAARKKGVLCIGISHQVALLSKKSPKPKKYNPLGKLILQHYAPSDLRLGFHFQQYDKQIYLPLIRKAIREAYVTDQKHYTVYLPAFGDDKILKTLLHIPEIRWKVFSKHAKKEVRIKNVHIFPINENKFTTSMINATGILCGAGFETPAEAIYLGKKLLVVPMKNQYEQQCNAEALKKMGYPVLKTFNVKQINKINAWIAAEAPFNTDPFPDHSHEAVKQLIQTVVNFTMKKHRVDYHVT